jgi:signal transduction histidine kinase
MLTLTFDKLITFIVANRPMIDLLSATVATIFALVFLLPIWKYKPVMVSRWGKAFGWAFFALAARYSVMFAHGLLSEYWTKEQADTLALPLSTNILLAAFSGLSNYMFLKVAIHLLAENRIRRSRPLLKLSLSSKALNLIVIIIILSVAFLGLYSDSWLARLPDSIISAFSIFMAGYAIYANVSVRRDLFVAYAALIIAILYGLVQIIYGLNPLFAQWLVTDGVAGNAFDQQFTARLTDLDSLIFASALPLKFGMFFPAYFLFMLVVSSVRDIQYLLKQIADGRQEFLEHGGLVKAISSSIKADRVSFSIKLPGVTRNRIASFVYLHRPQEQNPNETQDSQRKPIITDLNDLTSPAAKAVLTTGQPSIADQNIAFPVIFHGAVIGCLEAYLNSNKFTETDISELEDMARFVSPAGYAYRELASIDQISYRIARLQFGEKFLSASESLESVITILQDTLSPLEVEIFWDIGFNSIRAVKSRESNSESLEKESKEICAGVNLLPIKNDLILTLRKDIEWDDETKAANNIFFAQAGKITFCIPADKDDLLHPTLVTNYLHRRAISNVTVDGLLDLTRDYFNSVLQDFGVVLNHHRPTNLHSLCEAIDYAAQQAGLFWTVITSSSSRELSYATSSEANKIVHQLQQEEDSTQVYQALTSIELKSPSGETHHVIKIALEDTKQDVWFGVKRSGFGVELQFGSPWYVFLKQFAEISSAALLRITAAMDLKRYQLEAMKQLGMARSASNANILAHELKNLSGAVLKTISSLDEGAKTGKIDHNYSRMIAACLNSARKMSDITKVITKEMKLDNHQPCSLTEAAKHIARLRSDDFLPDDVILKVELNQDYLIDVPYYVVTLALDNLVSNARNAIVNDNGSFGLAQGRIFISGGREGELITCYINNNGPEIPVALRERIWETGYSTDPDSGGWGLPLVRDLLQENRSRIELLPSTGKGATFKISFPPAKTAKKDAGQDFKTNAAVDKED